MFELALHILDLAQNSIAANATVVTIVIAYENGVLTISIIDDGCGMTSEMLTRAVSPFGTSRKTRKVGLGIPMFKQLSELCEGEFHLQSAVGKGTTLSASFKTDNLDLPPLGDIPGTMMALLVGCPDKPEFVLKYSRDGGEFEFDTRQIRQVLDGVPLNEPDVLSWTGDYIKEGIEQVDMT